MTSLFLQYLKKPVEDHRWLSPLDNLNDVRVHLVSELFLRHIKASGLVRECEDKYGSSHQQFRAYINNTLSTLFAEMQVKERCKLSKQWTDRVSKMLGSPCLPQSLGNDERSFEKILGSDLWDTAVKKIRSKVQSNSLRTLESGAKELSDTTTARLIKLFYKIEILHKTGWMHNEEKFPSWREYNASASRYKTMAKLASFLDMVSMVVFVGALFVGLFKVAEKTGTANQALDNDDLSRFLVALIGFLSRCCFTGVESHCLDEVSSLEDQLFLDHLISWKEQVKKAISMIEGKIEGKKERKEEQRQQNEEEREDEEEEKEERIKQKDSFLEKNTKETGLLKKLKVMLAKLEGYIDVHQYVEQGVGEEEEGTTNDGEQKLHRPVATGKRSTSSTNRQG